MIVMSIAFCFGVSAHAFRWNKAGKVKAIGVQVSDPTTERKLSRLSPIPIVNKTVSPTKIVLVTFLDIYLFFVLAHPSYMIFSITILAG